MNKRLKKAFMLANFADVEPEGEGGLLDSGEGVQAEDAVQADAAEQQQEQKAQPEGLLASGDEKGEKEPQKGETKIPEQFLNKETGEVNVDALAKSYNDLRAEFNRMKNGQQGKSPEDAAEYFKSVQDEEGKFVMPDGTEKFKEIASDDPAMSAVANAAKEAGLTDKQFKTLVESVMIEWNGLLPEPLNMDAEREKLGKNAAALVNANKSWVVGLKEQGLLTDDMYARAMELGRDATGVQLMQALREQAGEMSIPTMPGSGPDAPMSADAWYNMQFETHAKDGENFQQFMERKSAIGEKIFGNAPAGSSPAGYGVPGTSTSHLRTKRG
jgi:hypothetical protein